MSRGSWSVVALTLLVGTVVGCTSDEPDPAEVGERADGTAAAFVAGLGDGDLADVPFAEELTGTDATADYADVVEGMQGARPEVTLGEVVEQGDAATATVGWSWPIADGVTWAYDSEIALRRTAEGEWQAEWGHDVVEPSLNANSVLETEEVTGERADIVAAGGVELVTARPVVRVGIDKTQVPPRQQAASATALARLAEVDVAPFVDRVAASGDSAFVEAIVYRRPDLPPALANGAGDVRGALLLDDELFLGPSRTFAAPLLGSYGEVTAEMIEEQPDRFELGDEAGLSGLQETYDDQLTGSTGLVVNAVGTDGKARELFREGGERGRDLVLTMDEQLQNDAEAVLADVPGPAALVAIRPSDGAVLAAANGPGNNGQNVATTGQYAPGSTFKSVSGLALLRSGLTPDARVPCTASITVDGRSFGNYDNYPSSGLGEIPFGAAMANSCNTAFIAERTRLDDGELTAAAASLGLGVERDLGYPAYLGQVPPPETETGRGADMIGQGTVLASPLAMATVAASIQAGRTVVPRLVADAVADADDAAPDVEPLTAAQARQLRGLLRGVVVSGSGSQLADLPGPPAIAKTGTAEYTADGELRNHAWMIAAQGDLAVAAFVFDGVSGSTTAGPLVRELLLAAR